MVVNSPPFNVGDARDSSSIPWLGRSPGGGNGNTLQYSCLGSPMEPMGYNPWGHKESDSAKHKVISNAFITWSLQQDGE